MPPSMVSRALIEGLLAGRDFPVTPGELAADAVRVGASADVLAALERLRAAEYRSANEVGDELFPVGPGNGRCERRPPRAESGEPPGRSSYVSAPSRRRAAG